MSGAPRTAAGNGAGRSQRRSAARLAAVQALYEMDMVGAPADEVLAEFLQRRWQLSAEAAGMAEPDADWLAGLVRGVSEGAQRLDDLIRPALAKDLALDRLETLLRVVLRAGAYELSAKPDVPTPVIISEYVDVTHAFFSGKEPALVNAILDTLARSLRPDGG
jgi:N utilization substance protein B